MSMKICEKCGAEFAGDDMFCSNCGGKLVEKNRGFGFCRYCGSALVNKDGLCTTCESKSKSHIHCSICGCALVNDYERENGVCVNCESPSNVSIAPPKYLKRLRVFEVLCYIGGVIGTLLLLPALGIASLIMLIPCIGVGAVLGALQEILKRIE